MNRRAFLALSGAAVISTAAPSAVATPRLLEPRVFPFPTITSAAGESARPAVFFHAHQDDETLTLGPSIEAHVAAGREVICVLATDGRSSSARASTGLSPLEFSAARDLELIAAYTALGVRRFYFEGAVDGALSDVQAEAIVNKWVDRFPLGSFKSQSFLDGHRDHAALGRALRKAWTRNRALDVRFYVQREDWSVGSAHGAWFEDGGPRTLLAAHAYRFVDRVVGRYGIGYLSVPGTFDALVQDNRTMVHAAF